MKWLTWITTYTLIILVELGDKTQVATLLLASNNPKRKWLVFGAGALALSLCVLLEVTVGTVLARYISQDMINQVTAVIFFIFGVITLTTEYAKSRGCKIRYGIFPVPDKENPSIETPEVLVRSQKQLPL